MESFNWKFYLEFNNDVIDTYGYSEESALNHYNNYGSMEDRITNEDILFKTYPLIKYFDIDYYLENNPDLITLNSKYKLIRHYLIQGYNENRKINFFSPIFLCFNFKHNLVLNNNKNPKISIIIPIYNRSKLINQCINSVLNQTYNNIEIIIIDDSSTDDTLIELEKYIDNSKIIILSNMNNYGCYTSINLGLNIASGEYITIHGSDDISLPNRFEEIMSQILQNNLLMCGNYILRSHFKNFQDINLNNAKDIFNSIVQLKMNNISHNSECCKPLVSLGTLVYHKSVFDTIGDYEYIRKGGDMVFFEKFLFNYEKIKFYKNDCSHRYLTKIKSGCTYKIIEDILYICSDIDQNNISSQNINFDINKYRAKLYEII